MEDTLTKSKHRHERIEYGGNESNFDNSNDIKGNNHDNIYASTGTDNSVEWTRALYNALIKLGRTTINREFESQPRKNGEVDHYQQHGTLDETGDSNELLESQRDANLPQMEQVTANLTARANILQEQIEKLLSEQQDNRSSSLQDMDNTDTESTLASTSSLQNQISNLQARCLLLEGQVTELVSCRTELQQRERRLRRNIYRMSAELMTPQQVVASAMSVNKENDNNDNDDIETAVQIEKQELVKLRQEHEALLESIQNKSSVTSSVNHDDDVTSHSANILLSKQVKEYQNKILQLEESITIAEQSIQELNEKLKSREEEISLLSQRQLSDDDRNKLESIASLQQQLHNSKESFTELETKFNKAEQMWSQSLGNEKAALHAISDLVQKFNKRWAELKSSAFTTTTTTTNTAAVDVNKDPSLVVSISNTPETELVDKTIASATDEPILSMDSEMNGDTHPQITMSKKIVELQHQLQQALENVRQAESSRENLKTALSLNATLQGKYDEMKAKYTAIQQQAATSRSANVVNSDNPVVAKKSSETKNRQSSSKISIAIDQQISESMTDLGALDGATTPLSTDIDLNPVISENGKSAHRKGKDGTSKPESSKSQNATEGGSDKTTANHNSSSNRTTSASASSSDKYRKARKDLAAMTANHATLMASNARLLKQINEKDEMNAKSLSTILHLKGLTEKLVEERDQLEAQMKTASQLALAARLATNAKERVSEELLKEKEESETCRIAVEEKLETTQKELHRISMEWANASSVIATKERELSNLTQRSNRLIEENEEQRNLIRKLKNTVSQSEREAREANEKFADLVSKFEKEDGKSDNNRPLGESSTRGVSSSSFTIEQLQTQVSVLKNRLACPVCHYRDKECIIIRCRHMHCKQCVDERISNRSRKCPTCNVKFAENEVETIFLS